MQHGIIILSLSTAPGLAAVGLLARQNGHANNRNIWIPVALTAAGFGLLATDYLILAGSGDLGPLWIAAALLTGAAIGWVTAARIPIPKMMRIIMGTAIALTYTFMLGITITPMLAFAAPVLGLVLLVLPRRHKALAEVAPA